MKKPLPEDAFDAKLKALSQLRQPDAKLQPLDNSGVDADDRVERYRRRAREATASAISSGRRVIRHWNLDYSMLGDRKFTVAIRIAMTSHGAITSAEIVDKARYAGDHDLPRDPRSARRNAVTLSSPKSGSRFPAIIARVMEFHAITLDPRDAASQREVARDPKGRKGSE